MSIKVKRIYASAATNDGTRVLVDRLWPRGVSKDEAALDDWLKELGPSTELRQWFDHDADKWSGFQRRYKAELKSHEDLWMALVERARKHRVTLLFGARDEDHNNAVALKSFLDAKL